MALNNLIMTKTANCLQLTSSEQRKLPSCDYCDGKLLYSVYKLLIKLSHRKNPPPGAIDLNIMTIKTKVYKMSYATCLKCNANYKLPNISYYSKFRNNNSYYLESIPDINKDLNYTVSVIIKTYHNSYNNITWHCTKENLNFHDKKTIRLTNYFLLLTKLRNAVKHLLTKQELKLGK